MIRVIMKWSWGLCTDLAFALHPRKMPARRPSDEGAVRPVIASNGVPFLQMFYPSCKCLYLSFYLKYLVSIFVLLVLEFIHMQFSKEKIRLCVKIKNLLVFYERFTYFKCLTDLLYKCTNCRIPLLKHYLLWNKIYHCHVLTCLHGYVMFIQMYFSNFYRVLTFSFRNSRVQKHPTILFYTLQQFHNRIDSF